MRVQGSKNGTCPHYRNSVREARNHWRQPPHLSTAAALRLTVPATRVISLFLYLDVGARVGTVLYSVAAAAIAATIAADTLGNALYATTTTTKTTRAQDGTVQYLLYSSCMLSIQHRVRRNKGTNLIDGTIRYTHRSWIYFITEPYSTVQYCTIQ